MELRGDAWEIAFDEFFDSFPRVGPLPDEARLLADVMEHKILVRALGALGYELGPSRFVLSLGPDSPLDPARVLRLVQAKGSRWKLSPDMRLGYAFHEDEKHDRLGVARVRLREVAECRPSAARHAPAPNARKS